MLIEASWDCILVDLVHQRLRRVVLFMSPPPDDSILLGTLSVYCYEDTHLRSRELNISTRSGEILMILNSRCVTQSDRRVLTEPSRTAETDRLASSSLDQLPTAPPGGIASESPAFDLLPNDHPVSNDDLDAALVVAMARRTVSVEGNPRSSRKRDNTRPLLRPCSGRLSPPRKMRVPRMPASLAAPMLLQEMAAWL